MYKNEEPEKWMLARDAKNIFSKNYTNSNEHDSFLRQI